VFHLSSVKTAAPNPFQSGPVLYGAVFFVFVGHDSGRSFDNERAKPETLGARRVKSEKGSNMLRSLSRGMPSPVS
jgi:hypothetical protein